MDTHQRLHALDNLRAAMMWLGIVLHVAVNHLAGESPVAWRDARTTEVADLLVAAIHAFRMPVFFILAGFFVAMLTARRGRLGMLKHRLLRLGVPFVLFWPPVFAAMGLLGMLYMHRMAHGSFGLDPALLPRTADQPALNTLHLWFLYLLLWFSVATAALGGAAAALPARLRCAVAAALRRACAAWWAPLALAVPLAIVGASSRNGIVLPSGSFLPPWTEWAHNGIFFAFGLHLHRERDALAARLRRRRVALAIAGVPFFAASGALMAALQRTPDALPWAPFAIAYAYNVATWLWSFALIGAFLEHVGRPHRVLRYLAGSAYWVYLVHMIGTIGFGVLLQAAPWPPLLKMALNIAATTFACLATWELFVRRTALGRLLGGADAAAAAPRAGFRSAPAASR